MCLTAKQIAERIYSADGSPKIDPRLMELFTQHHLHLGQFHANGFKDRVFKMPANLKYTEHLTEGSE